MKITWAKTGYGFILLFHKRQFPDMPRAKIFNYANKSKNLKYRYIIGIRLL